MSVPEGQGLGELGRWYKSELSTGMTIIAWRLSVVVGEDLLMVIVTRMFDCPHYLCMLSGRSSRQTLLIIVC